MPDSVMSFRIFCVCGEGGGGGEREREREIVAEREREIDRHTEREVSHECCFRLYDQQVTPIHTLYHRYILTHLPGIK